MMGTMSRSSFREAAKCAEVARLNLYKINGTFSCFPNFALLFRSELASRSLLGSREQAAPAHDYKPSSAQLDRTQCLENGVASVLLRLKPFIKAKHRAGRERNLPAHIRDDIPGNWNGASLRQKVTLLRHWLDAGLTA